MDIFSPTFDGIESLTVDALTTTDLSTNNFTTSFVNDIPVSYFTGIRSNIQAQIDTFATPGATTTSTVLLQANSSTGKIIYTSDGLVPSVANTVTAKLYGNTSKEFHVDFNNSLNFNSTNDFGSTTNNVMRIEPNQIINKKDTRILGYSLIEFGYGETKDYFAGMMTYRGLDWAYNDGVQRLHIVGAGTVNGEREVLIWDRVLTSYLKTLNELTSMSNINLAGNNALKIGYNVSGKNYDAGWITYGYYDTYNPGENNLYIVGAGTDDQNRQVYIYDKLKVKYDITAGRRIYTPALTLNGTDIMTTIGSKQDTLTASSNITVGNIVSKNITIGSTFDLTVNGTTLTTSLAAKQNSLNATTDLQVKGLNCYGDLVVGQTGWNNAIYLNGAKLVVKQSPGGGGLYIVPIPVVGGIGGGFFGGGGGGGGGGGSGGSDPDGDTSNYDYERRISALEGKTVLQTGSLGAARTSFTGKVSITDPTGVYASFELQNTGSISMTGNIDITPYLGARTFFVNGTNGNITASGSAIITGNMDISGNQRVTGNVTMDGALTVASLFTTNNSINVGGSPYSLSSNHTINGTTLNVNCGIINLNGLVNFPNNFLNGFINQFAV